MRVLVTGAGGFVGKWLCSELLSHGHDVIGGVRSVREARRLDEPWGSRLRRVQWISLDLGVSESLDAAILAKPDAVIHLAAIASGAEARANPMLAWRVNCAGTCELVYAIERSRHPLRLLFASTGEVYGRVTRPVREEDPVAPCSSYAASKAGAELAVMEYQRRTGAWAAVARPFAQTGPGQSEQFVVGAFARRLLAAKRASSRTVPVGNLEAVREFLDVRDVASALRLLLERGQSGAIYNISRGEGTSLRDLLRMLADILGTEVEPRTDETLLRSADLPFLVGDGTLIRTLGWRPSYELRTTLTDTVMEIQR